AASELPGEVLAWDGPAWRSRALSADLVVNATPLGRQGPSPLAAADLPTRGAVLDLVYRRGGTDLVREARERGIPAQDGWAVLAAQGAASFEAWTGLRAPLEVMLAALREAE
ncbi:MAG: shikimate dehydrogenase family protein, partial [Candidatus Dormibacterales bacterium]